jgi:hypothetical protein
VEEEKGWCWDPCHKASSSAEVFGNHSTSRSDPCTVPGRDRHARLRLMVMCEDWRLWIIVDQKILCFFGTFLLLYGSNFSYILHNVVQTRSLLKIFNICVFWNENTLTFSDLFRIQIWVKAKQMMSACDTIIKGNPANIFSWFL